MRKQRYSFRQYGRITGALLAGVCALSLTFAPAMEAQAGTGVVYEWHNDGFDADLYGAMYPDLAAAFGNNPTLMYKHFRTTGYYEGRIGKMKMPVTNKLTVLQNGKYFNAAQYAIDNPDVAAVLGNDPAVLWAHYLNNGFAEGRQVHANDLNKEAELILIDTVNSITNPAMTDTEKIKACHDWLVNKMDYNSVPDNTPSVYACIYLGQGVCHQYTEVFEYMMDVLGIESQYLLGFSSTGGAHGWNRVKVDGVWKYIDCTWDDMSLYGDYNIHYTYFLLSLEEISKTHVLMTTDGYTNWTGWSRADQERWYGLQHFDSQTMVGLDP